METLPYFRDHPPTALETVVVRDARPELLAFTNAALEWIGKVAEQAGFVRRLTQVVPFYVTLRYRKGPLMVEVSASTDPREQPDHFNVILGVEDAAGVMYPLALWRMQRLAEGTDRGTEYAFPFGDAVIPCLQQAADDLAQFGAGFLAGDLELFEAARAKLASEGGYG